MESVPENMEDLKRLRWVPPNLCLKIRPLTVTGLAGTREGEYILFK